jgi:hypothetical protein
VADSCQVDVGDFGVGVENDGRGVLRVGDRAAKGVPGDRGCAEGFVEAAIRVEADDAEVRAREPVVGQPCDDDFVVWLNGNAERTVRTPAGREGKACPAVLIELIVKATIGVQPCNNERGSV